MLGKSKFVHDRVASSLAPDDSSRPLANVASVDGGGVGVGGDGEEATVVEILVLD